MEAPCKNCLLLAICKSQLTDIKIDNMKGHDILNSLVDKCEMLRNYCYELGYN
jgi:hypothetical protein